MRIFQKLLFFLLPTLLVGRDLPSTAHLQEGDLFSWSQIKKAGDYQGRHGAVFQLTQIRDQEKLSATKEIALSQTFQVNLPRPDGSLEAYILREAPTMDPELAAKYPQVRTFRGRSVTRPGSYAAIELYQGQLSGTIFDGRNSSILRPLERRLSSVKESTPGASRLYEAAWRRDFPRTPLNCDVIDPVQYRQMKKAKDPDKEEIAPKMGSNRQVDPVSSTAPSPGSADRSIRETGTEPIRVPLAANRGDVLYTYRMAIAVTGEWTTRQAVDPSRDAVEQAMAALNIAMNRINAVYEVELGVRFLLVASNDQLIFTDPDTDPYPDPTDRIEMLNLHADGTLNDLVGVNNYDIGHVFSTSPFGGVAFLGVIDDDEFKGCGVSSVYGLPDDPGFVDIFLHEVGHQAAANHTWNYYESSPGQRRAGTAYEPGEGSTIMSYGGEADVNYFHAVSYEEVNQFITGSPTRLNAVLSPVTSPTSGRANQPPSVFAGNTKTIPARTPIYLTAYANDPDGDPLLYTWEQYNLGPAKPIDEPDDGLGPIIGSLPPSLDPVRRIPTLENLANGVTLDSITLPSTFRTLTFNARVRDGNGGVDTSIVSFNITTNAGPFRVLTPEPGGPSLTQIGGSTLDIRWNPANTNGPEVNTANVEIFLSTDGINFDQKIATTANDGSYLYTLPDGVNTTQARFMIQALNNSFFNVSEAPFTIFDSTDSDQDGLPDGYESAFGLNPTLNSDAVLDSDQDGLTNLEEFAAGTDPSKSDTDGDFLNDGDEINLHASNPLRADSDEDGFFDNFEINRGSDPLNPSSLPGVPTRRFYVNAEANPPMGGDGTSWDRAFQSLQDALMQASIVDEIWVARGRYTPDQGLGFQTGDRNATFQLVNDVVILGGFDGTETSANERDWVANQVILSGDLLENDNGNIVVSEPTRKDNAYSVITGSGVNSEAVLDGFIISGGNADVVSQESSILGQGRGAGIWVNGGGAPVFRNCVIRDNSAANDGGGVYSLDGPTTQFFDCVFLNNFAGRQAGAARVFEARTDFIRCVFAGNVSDGFVGGVNLTGINPGNGSTGVFINCIFAGNKALAQGIGVGAILSIDSLLYLEGVTSINNDGPEARFLELMGDHDDWVAELINSVLWETETEHASSPVLQLNGLPLSATNTFAANTTQINHAGITLTSQSPFADVLSPSGADRRWATRDDGLHPALGSILLDRVQGPLAGSPASSAQSGGLPQLNQLRGDTDLKQSLRTQGTFPDAGALEGALDTTDTDQDGLFDSLETGFYNTLPSSRDSDGDGISDGDEVAQFGTDPRDPRSFNRITRHATLTLSDENEMVIAFDFASTPGRFYRIWYTLQLGTPFQAADIVRGDANSDSTAIEIVIPNSLISAPQEEPVYEVPASAYVFVEAVQSILP